LLSQTLSSQLFFSKIALKYVWYAISYTHTRYNHAFKIVSDISNENLEKVNADFKKAILPNTLSQLPQIGITVEQLRSLYFGQKEISKETLINYEYFLGDEFFVRDIMNVVELQKSSGGYKSTYLYHFDYESKTPLMRKVLNITGPPGILSR